MMKAEEIEQRIKDEYRKHSTLDWAKIASVKIAKSYKDFAKQDAIECIKVFHNLPVGILNDWASGCITDDELYQKTQTR